MSLGSLFAALLVGATILTVPSLRAYWLLGLLVPLLVCYTHRSNIQRILDGTEHKIGSPNPAEPPSTSPIPPENEEEH